MARLRVKFELKVGRNTFKYVFGQTSVYKCTKILAKQEKQ